MLSIFLIIIVGNILAHTDAYKERIPYQVRNILNTLWGFSFFVFLIVFLASALGFF